MALLRPDPQNNRMSIAYCRDVDDVTAQAAELFVDRARSLVASHGRFTMALSSCTTAMQLNARLGSGIFRSRVPWSQIHMFWVDDSCSHKGARSAKYEMIEDVLLSHISIPRRNVYALSAGQSDCRRAAAEYEQTLRAFFGLGTGQLPRFDLIWLAMAPDGHIASLFPGTSAVEETARLVAPTYVHQLGEHRVTLTAPVISNAANIILLVVGVNRAPILREVLTGEYQPERLPLQLIQPTDGELFYFIDHTAARQLLPAEGA